MNSTNKPRTQPVILGSDIEKLLKDPKSWLYKKLYSEWLERDGLIAYFNEQQFIHYLQQVRQEEVEQLDSEARLRAAVEKAHALQVQGETVPYSVYVSKESEKTDVSPMAVLQVQLAALLSLNQSQMTQAQLTAHYNNLTANYFNQIKAKIGPTITINFNGVPVTGNVSQLSSRPAPSTEQVLKVLNPDHTLGAKEIKHFADHHTKSVLSHFAPLNIMRDFLEFNREQFMEKGIDIDNINLKPSQFKGIDAAAFQCREENKELQSRLFENDALMLKKILGKQNAQVDVMQVDRLNSPTSRPSKPPAMFSPYQTKPTPGQKKRPQDELIHVHESTRPIRGR